MNGIRRWPSFLRRSRNLTQDQTADVAARIIADFADRQAELMYAGKVSREEARIAIADRFPVLTRRQVADTLADALFRSR
jgi:hypothetical protein